MTADLLTSAAADDFDLADALDPSNDIGVKDKNKGGTTSRRIRDCSKVTINSDPSRWSSRNSELLGCFHTGGAQVGPGSIRYHVGMETVRAAGMVGGCAS